MTDAIYPGSFDPLTNGHMDLIHRAAKLFDHLTIAIIDNPNKSHLLTLDERKTLVLKCVAGLGGVEVDSFSGLLVNYCKSKKIRTVVRGLRSVHDFEFEQPLAQMNAKLAPNLETVFLPSCPENTCISSSLVKEIHGLDGDVSGLVPSETLAWLK